MITNIECTRRGRLLDTTWSYATYVIGNDVHQVKFDVAGDVIDPEGENIPVSTNVDEYVEYLQTDQQDYWDTINGI